MKNLIIGKNSRIISVIKKNLVNFDFISNTQIAEINFNEYKYIYLFSWDFKSNNNNLNNINIIPSEKLIFISTVAILSLQKRTQFQNYPNDKKKAEIEVIKKNGRIVRLGVFNQGDIKNYFGNIPITTYEMLTDFLNLNVHKENLLINLIDIKKSNLSLKNLFWRKFYILSLIFPSKKIFQIFFSGIPKILGFKSYGYSADCSEYFCNCIQIGYGVFGSRIKKNKIDKYITSDKKDLEKNNNGFKGTIIGYKDNGLSKFWHGVKIKNNKKKIPFLIGRSSPPRNAFKFHVIKITFVYDNFVIKCEDKFKKIFFLYSKNIVLAAGTFENIKLLSNFANIKETSFSDHEQGLIGKITFKEAQKQKLIESFGIFVLNKKIIKYNIFDHELMIEFRPEVFQKNKNYSNIFYSRSTINIILKLIKNFKFSRINEAFYNKFNYGIKTKNLNVFIQIKNNNCIKYKKDKFSRSRITLPTISKILKEISIKINGFKKINDINLSDAQHTVGGQNILENNEIKKLINQNRLNIYGSPTNFNLTSTHHSYDYIDWYKKYN